MAAGLGTRMRSATPKHLHPLLGRRMVDWVIAAARDAGAEPIVVVASPQTRDGFDGLEVAVQEQPLGTGDAVRAAREKLDSANGDVLVLSGDTPLLTRGRAARAARDAPARARRRDGSLVRAARPARSTDASSATGTAGSRASSRRPTRRPTSSSSARSTRRSTSSPRRSCGRRSSGCSRRTRRASSTSPMRSASSCRTASPSRSTSPTIRARSEGVNTRVELAAAAAALRDRINEAHMLAGVTIVDPQSTWIDGGVEIENDVTIHPFTVIRGDVQIASGVEVGPFAYVRPGTEVGRDAKIGTFVEVKKSTRRRAHQDPAPLVHRRRRDRRGYEHRRRQHHRELQARAGAAEGRHSDRQQRQDRSRQYVRCSGRDRRRRCGLHRVRSSRKMSRPARLRGSRHARRRKRGWVYDKRGNRDD